MSTNKINEILKLVHPENLITVIQTGIDMERLTLEAAEAAGIGPWERTLAQNRIADARILVCLLKEKEDQE